MLRDGSRRAWRWAEARREQEARDAEEAREVMACLAVGADGMARVRLSAPCPPLVALIKDIPGRRWVPGRGAWLFLRLTPEGSPRR